MSGVIITLGWIGFVASALLTLLFLGTSLVEREGRAAILTGLVCGPLLVVSAIVLLSEGPLRGWIVLGMLGVGLGLVLPCVLPFGARRGIRVFPGRREQVDERDALFHRFYRLEPGTPDFEAYYDGHPELAAPDAEIRGMPTLGAPGSRLYDPVASPAFVAGFAVSEQLAGAAARATPQGPPAAGTPKEFARRVKGLARTLGADLVGCARLDPAYVYSHVARGQGAWGSPIDLDHDNAIAVAVRMRSDMIRHAPQAAVTVETALRYVDTTTIAVVLARFICELGYRARAHVDSNYQVMCVPVAADAGLGELGRLGLLITPDFGPRVRLAVVTTDMPLAHDPAISFGVQDFCEACKKCATCCPSDSLAAGGKLDVRGVEKWQSRQTSCYRYWRRCGTDCGICIKVCPYAHPASLAHDLVRWSARQNPVARRLARWADDLAYGRRPRRRYPDPPWGARNQKP